MIGTPRQVLALANVAHAMGLLTVAASLTRDAIQAEALEGAPRFNDHFCGLLPPTLIHMDAVDPISQA